MAKSGFVWTVGDHQYVLVPEVRQSPRRTWLMGAGMYSLEGEYVGYWARFNMPYPLIRALTKFARAKLLEVPVVYRDKKQRRIRGLPD